MGPDANNKKDAKNEYLTICVRIRPMTSDEHARGHQRVLNPIDEKMLVLSEVQSDKLDPLRNNRVKNKKFMYDVVFNEESHQDNIYKKTTRPLIDDVLNGFNATIFAYGPTGTGKTFTMVGTPEQPGIMVRALNDLFKKMETGVSRFKISMSYLEIYNENIRDLLNCTGKKLDLREDAKNGVAQVTGLCEIATTSTKEVMRLLQKGNRERIIESTAANAVSSRSHAMLQVNVHLSSHAYGQGEEVKTGRLFMIDLAGSERAKMTQNRGKRLQEGGHINKSLLALGNVINALAEGRAKYVNFRDSKLTRLLKDALAGNCKTVMIAHVSPVSIHREESRNTLNYADRAKNISNSVRQTRVDVAYHIEQYKQIITELKQEITRLKSKLGENGIGAVRVPTPKKEYETISKLKIDLVTSFTSMMELRKKIMEIDSNILSVSMELERINLLVDEWEAEETKKDSNQRRRNSDSADASSLCNEEEPEEITQACEDILYLEGEQKRHLEMREAVQKEMMEMQGKVKEIEEGLPLRSNSTEQRELLTLLCKVHELEIHQVEMESDALIKENELRRKDIQILRYDRQRALTDEIITKQRSAIEKSGGQSAIPELQKLYLLYQMENQNIERSPSVMSYRGIDKLPHIYPNNKGSPERLFKPARRHSLTDDRRPSTPLALRSPLSSESRSKRSQMPNLLSRRESLMNTPSQSPSRRKAHANIFPPIR